MEPFILIIESRMIERGRLAVLLESKGYNIRFASDATAALRMLIHIRPALIIIGVIMTGLDSFTFTKILKNDDDTRDLKIIALLDRDDEINQEQISDIGFNGFLKIGINKKLFLQEIEENLNSAKTKN
ncbi:MAG: response regulator [Bacteroidia bacterium]